MRALREQVVLGHASHKPSYSVVCISEAALQKAEATGGAPASGDYQCFRLDYVLRRTGGDLEALRRDRIQTVGVKYGVLERHATESFVMVLKGTEDYTPHARSVLVVDVKKLGTRPIVVRCVESGTRWNVSEREFRSAL